MQPETQYDFTCPYCWKANQLTADISEGLRQELTVDCENCCAPILVKIDLAAHTIEAFKENE